MIGVPMLIATFYAKRVDGHAIRGTFRGSCREERKFLVGVAGDNIG